ncbi:hypothetical protein T10_544 [Trichinella papuae]|uniref:C2H2-type domain-containing protein n=1 Tax=Trichinella papuae TaxID=268474 RepID=A0A0V1MLE3_9BILA|nr:hypothetical protein T10_544 [Trichinella papuae]
MDWMTQIQMANDHLPQTSDSTRKRVLALLLLSLCNSCLVGRGVVCHVQSGQARHGKENHSDKLVEQRKDCSLRRQKPNLRCPDCKRRFADPRYMKRHCSGFTHSNLESEEEPVRLNAPWRVAENDFIARGWLSAGLLLPVIIAAAHEEGLSEKSLLNLPADYRRNCFIVQSACGMENLRRNMWDIGKTFRFESFCEPHC